MYSVASVVKAFSGRAMPNVNAAWFVDCSADQVPNLTPDSCVTNVGVWARHGCATVERLRQLDLSFSASSREEEQVKRSGLTKRSRGRGGGNTTA